MSETTRLRVENVVTNLMELGIEEMHLGWETEMIVKKIGEDLLKQVRDAQEGQLRSLASALGVGLQALSVYQGKKHPNYKSVQIASQGASTAGQELGYRYNAEATEKQSVLSQNQSNAATYRQLRERVNALMQELMRALQEVAGSERSAMQMMSR
jgi:hypothetical protein